MAIGPERNYMTRAQAGVADIDVGLRQYMLKVYDYMAGGLVLTGLIAFAAVNIPAVREIVFPLRFVALFATFGIALFMGFRIHAMRAATAQALFWIYAALMGVWISPILLIYTGASIAQTFFITAGTFAAMSLYGYTTRRDLSQFGAFLFMGLIGIIIAGLVNIFIGSTALQFAISVIGVIVFTGLTAWDTQQIKEMYYEGDGSEIASKKAIMGALRLYLDFINLFMMLMQLLGTRRD